MFCSALAHTAGFERRKRKLILHFMVRLYHGSFMYPWFICLLHVIIGQTCRKHSRLFWIRAPDGSKTDMRICMYNYCTTKLVTKFEMSHSFRGTLFVTTDFQNGFVPNRKFIQIERMRFRHVWSMMTWSKHIMRCTKYTCIYICWATGRSLD